MDNSGGVRFKISGLSENEQGNNNEISDNAEESNEEKETEVNIDTIDTSSEEYNEELENMIKELRENYAWANMNIRHLRLEELLKRLWKIVNPDSPEDAPMVSENFPLPVIEKGQQSTLDLSRIPAGCAREPRFTEEFKRKPSTSRFVAPWIPPPTYPFTQPCYYPQPSFMQNHFGQPSCSYAQPSCSYEDPSSSSHSEPGLWKEVFGEVRFPAPQVPLRRRFRRIIQRRFESPSRVTPVNLRKTTRLPMPRGVTGPHGEQLHPPNMYSIPEEPENSDDSD